MTIHTIGYEGVSPDDFLHSLKAHSIDTLVDVRAVAVSRRRGFSKTALSLSIQEAGMNYIHLRDLGDPKPGREAARSGMFRLFEQIYDAHLKTPEAQAALIQLTKLAQSRSIALMCFEADALHCHRTVIARRLAKSLNRRIVNVQVRNSGLAFGTRACHHSGEGLAAA